MLSLPPFVTQTAVLASIFLTGFQCSLSHRLLSIPPLSVALLFLPHRMLLMSLLLHRLLSYAPSFSHRLLSCPLMQTAPHGSSLTQTASHVSHKLIHISIAPSPTQTVSYVLLSHRLLPLPPLSLRVLPILTLKDCTPCPFLKFLSHALLFLRLLSMPFSLIQTAPYPPTLTQTAPHTPPRIPCYPYPHVSHRLIFKCPSATQTVPHPPFHTNCFPCPISHRLFHAHFSHRLHPMVRSLTGSSSCTIF